MKQDLSWVTVTIIITSSRRIWLLIKSRQRKTTLKGANTAKPNPAHDDDHDEDHHGHHHTEDHDHGFDANRVISEDDQGFIMSHGDHNHHFFKKDLTVDQIKAAQDHLKGANTAKTQIQLMMTITMKIIMDTIMMKTMITVLMPIVSSKWRWSRLVWVMVTTIITSSRRTWQQSKLRAAQDHLKTHHDAGTCKPLAKNGRVFSQEMLAMKKNCLYCETYGVPLEAIRISNGFFVSLGIQTKPTIRLISIPTLFVRNMFVCWLNWKSRTWFPKWTLYHCFCEMGVPYSLQVENGSFVHSSWRP